MDFLKDFLFNIIFIAFVIVIVGTILFVFYNQFNIQNDSLEIIVINIILMGMISKYLMYRIMTNDYEKNLLIKKEYYTTKFEELYEKIKGKVKKKFRYLKSGILKLEIMKGLILAIIYTINIFYMRIANSLYEIIVYNIVFIFIYLLLHLLEQRYVKKVDTIYKTEVLSAFVKEISNEYTFINPLLEQDITNMQRKYVEMYQKSNEKNSILFNPKIMITNETTCFYTSLIASTFNYGNELDYFNGLYVYTKLENSFDRQIHVINKRIDNKNKYDIDTGNAEFEKLYNTLCEEKAFAKKILDKKLTTYLVGFYNKYNVRLSIDIDKHFMNIRFYINNMFDFDIFSAKQLKKQLFMFYVIHDFVEYTKTIIDSNY